MSSNIMTASQLALLVSTATLNDLAVAGEAKAEMNRGPLVTMFDFRRDFGDKMTMVPDLDTENEAGKPAKYSNPEWTQEETTNPTTGAVGHRRMSYFWKLADETSTGAPIAIGERPKVVGGTEIQDLLEWITVKMADKSYVDKTTLKKERSYWAQRKQVNRNNVRKAFQIDQHMRRVLASLPRLDVIVLMDDARDADGIVIEGKQEVTTAQLAIKVYEKDPAVATPPWIISYGTFLRTDPEAAKLNGGTLKDLAATIVRGSGAADTTGKLATAMTFKELEGAAVRMSKLLDTDDITKVITRESKKEGTGKLFAFHLYELYLALGGAVVDLEPLWKQVNAEADAAEAEARKQLEGKAAA